MNKLKASILNGYVARIEHYTGEEFKVHSAAEYRKFIALEQELKSDSVVIDAGAYVGSFSIACSKIIKDGTIHSFEPCMETYNNLVKNVTELSQIRCYHVALSNYTGTGLLCSSWAEDYPQGRFIVQKDLDMFSSKDNVYVTTIDRFVEFYKIGKVDLIKIDVEGQDLQVLQGADETLNNPDIVVLLEIHPGNDKRFAEEREGEIGVTYGNKFKDNKAEIMDFLINKGFIIYDLDTNYDRVYKDSLIKTTGIVEVMALRH